MVGRNNAQALEYAILEIAQQEARAILDTAKAKADSIRRQAEIKAQVESERILEEAQRDVKPLVDQATAKAQLEAQMLRLQRRERLLEHTFDIVRRQLATIPQRPDYADIVQYLIREAATHLGDEVFIVEADAKTRAVLSESFRLYADLWDKKARRGPQPPSVAVYPPITHKLAARAVARSELTPQICVEPSFLNHLAEDLNVSLEFTPRGEGQLEENTSFKGTGIVLTTAGGHRRYDNTLEARLTRMQDGLRAAVYHILAEDALLAEGAQ